MFGRKRSRPQPYATYLLPSFPSLSWSKKLSPPAAVTPVAAKATKVAEASEASSIVSPRDSIAESDIPSYRYSLASTTSASSSSSSTATVTSTATAPSLSTSLSTSPSSLLSTTPHSLSSATLPVPFPCFDAPGPAFLNALSAEPEIVQDNSPKKGDAVPTFKLGPQVGPSACPRQPYPGRVHPSRRLQRVLPTTLRCRRCSADLAFASQIVSKGFTGRHGRAYLVSAPATHADHLFAPETKVEETVRENEEAGAVWEETGFEERDDDDDEEDEESPFARGLVREGGIKDLPNIRIGKAEYRRLVTGAHVVADISCAVCCAKVGWKYIDASDAAQRYKVGKFILELAMLSTYHSWEDTVDADAETDTEAAGGGGVPNGVNAAFGDVASGDALSNPLGAVRALNAHYRHDRLQAEGEYYSSDDDDDPNRIEFDSEDEDECEEIFNGTWNAEVVARRRAMKRADELRRSFPK
ncbi:hypothetical protein SEUCBS139899_002786 [Sporothrix eucalyptigena]